MKIDGNTLGFYQIIKEKHFVKEKRKIFITQNL